MKENTKNKLILMIALVIIVILAILSFTLPNKSKDKISKESSDLLDKATKESKLVSSEEKKDFTKISVDEFLNYYGGEENKLVLVGRSGCLYCQVAEPIIQNIMYRNNLDIYYVSTDDFDKESYEKFINSNDILKNFSTPLLMVVSKGQILDYYEGLTDTNGYIEFLNKNEFIK